MHTVKRNKGITLIELLIAMAIFSIIMLMVVQFMSTTSAAYKKTKSNVDLQTEALQVMDSMSDILMQANYIRISPGKDTAYILEENSKDTTTADARKFYAITSATLKTGKAPSGGSGGTGDESSEGTTGDDSKGADLYYYQKTGQSDEEYAENVTILTNAINNLKKISFDFVPDNFPNYTKPATEAEERQIIINYDNYKLINKKNNAYPIEGDNDYVDSGSNDVRSFQMLAPVDFSRYFYIQPKYIYAEYVTEGNELMHIIYYIVDNKIYLYRYAEKDHPGQGYSYAASEVKKLGDAKGTEGLLTDLIGDFYLSADASGNALLTNVLFVNNKYQYNSKTAINFRNTNVLSVRPQNMYKKTTKTLPGTTPEGEGSGGTGGGGSGGATANPSAS